MIREILLSIEQGCDNAAEISQATGFNPREVQDHLHILDDEGRVLMRNGVYKLSEAEKRK